MTALITAEKIAKTFTLHMQGGLRIPVLSGLDFTIDAGECVALAGASGSGKSTFMRMIYANYTCLQGNIWVRHDGARIDMAHASPHQVLDIRRHTMGYVSQFLRVVPRIATIDIVAEPLVVTGCPKAEATERAAGLLRRLNIPETLWSLSPVTFSGGEQQRVNIARGFAHPYPIMLLDEPTASLDADNRAVVLALIGEARARGAAIIGIFHDLESRRAVCTRSFDISEFQVAA